MCDRASFENACPKAADWSLNRRRFVALGAAGVLAACAPVSGGEEGEAGAESGVELIEDDVAFETPDGTIDAFFVRPVAGAHPAILTWPDIAGLREAFKVMARRLAEQGYAVLVVNPYYRSRPAPQFADFADFRANDGFQAVAPWREAFSPDAIRSDAAAAIAWLDAQDGVDSARGVGTHGYCMGGSFAVITAAAVPDRVRAAASLHGGRLVQEDDPQSPHRLLAATQASYLFAIAANDDAEEPEVKTALAAAAEAAARPADVEVYAADHGWTVIDSPVYYETEAERAWAAMSALFDASL